MQNFTTITVSLGDGIGPEIMKSVLKIFDAAEVPLNYEFIEIGEKAYYEGYLSGIKPKDWEVLKKNKIFFKSPITTPRGSGYKSLNVTIRKTFGLYANVRPCVSYHPFVFTRHPNLDIVIIRENEEDLYAGIEYQQTSEVVETLKLITYPGSEKIIRYAFEYARAYNRKKVTCMVKDNIMKHSDGLFQSVFQEISKEYPDIESNSQIIDIGAAHLADRPEKYDIVVTMNLYGDILSDLVAQIAGSVGMGGSANIGDRLAMFEAIHGSAPDIAGKNIANPSGLLNAGIMMLVHMGFGEHAKIIHNAWLKTIEDGIHTADIYQDGISKKKVSTEEFTHAVIERIKHREQPKILKPANYEKLGKGIPFFPYKRKTTNKELVGVDIFIDYFGEASELGEKLTNITKHNTELRLKMITNRGMKVYPNEFTETFCSNYWRCRFISKKSIESNVEDSYVAVKKEEILKLISILYDSGFEVVKVQNLYLIDGVRGFSLGQAE
ncbi:MAG: NADP-dependent isocitrate dehydrogenase [Leptospiraceae bacterium]|nr:NADP-dependent isocitrate dehydrogenase [Leptospiraceae bacterium]MDW7975136.1 NADP-dependent isocitrate dehydrogenase [Leptospiraceae bacterium]